MKKLFIFATAVGLLFTACSNDDTVENPDDDNTSTSCKYLILNEDGVWGINTFSCHFMDKACEYWAENGVANAAISPLGAAINLGMAANGCTGESQKEIIDAFRQDIDVPMQKESWEDPDVEGLNAALAEIIEKLPAVNPKTKVTLANSVWVDQGYEFSNNFVNTMSMSYLAQSNTTDLNSDAGKREIDAWITDNTGGAITDIYRPAAGEYNYASLLNALIFESKWARKFDEKNTQPRTFHNYDGTESRVEMMEGEQSVAYLETDEEVVVSLYFANMTYSINILMPKKAKPVNTQLLLPLAAERVYHKRTLRGDTKIVLPKPAIDSETDLTPILQRMGINSIFKESSDFEIMFDPSNPPTTPIHVSSFNQAIRTAFSEDEVKVTSGTNTVFSGVLINIPDSLPKEIVIDKPFLFTITDTKMGVVLLMAKVNQL